MKLIYTNENRALVNNAKNIVEKVEIAVVLKNEHASAGMHPQYIFLELWVINNSDTEKTISLLDLSLNQESSIKWICNICNEENDGLFELCWNCQTENS